mgnify:CR=1 FL=1
MGGHGIHVEVVVAHGHVGADFQVGAGVQQGGVDAHAAGGEGALFALQAGDELLGAPLLVGLVGLDVEVGTQALDGLREDRAGHQDLGACHGCVYRKKRKVVAINRGIRMAQDQSM